MTYGGIVQSRRDSAASSKASEAQLDAISRDLADLKGRPKSDLSNDAIQRVEIDIAKWAEEFASKKQQRKLQVEQQISAHQSTVDHTNELIRGYFIFFVSVVQKALATYTADSAIKIEMDLPEISPTLFSDPDSRYEGRAIFSPTVYWNIHTFYDTQSPDLAGPSFIIVLLKSTADGKGVKEHGELMVRFSTDAKFFHIRLQRDFLLAVPIHSKRDETSKYEETLKSILKGLIEFQLSQE
jgi:hypothetical protein